jgi:hypothetical protein
MMKAVNGERALVLAAIPCIRHGEPGVRDARLLELLSEAQNRVPVDLSLHLRALTCFNGQLWCTWKDAAARSKLARVIDKVWKGLGESGSTMHLVPSDEPYDYQEEVMNNAGREEIMG